MAEGLTVTEGQAGQAVSVTVLAVGMLTMFATGDAREGIFLSAALWGFGFGGMPTTALSRGGRVEPTRLEQIGGLIVTICNVAVAVGAGICGLLVDGAAPEVPLLLGGAAAVIGALLLTSLRESA